jgi:hypothetical protein
VAWATHCPCSEGTKGDLKFEIFLYSSKALFRFAHWQQVASVTRVARNPIYQDFS